jgi:DNA-binding transcriptional ArsR family regulator
MCRGWAEIDSIYIEPRCPPLVRPRSKRSGITVDAMAADTSPARGDAEISTIAALLADRARCRVLMALNDGRALPASVLADEAGITRATASSHLAKLTEAGLLNVEPQGRHRYYRLAGPHVGELLEKLMELAPARPIRSLRESTQAGQLRAARACYDHLAGRLGVEIMAAMIDAGYLEGGDGRYDPQRGGADRVSGYGRDVAYSLTSPGWCFLDGLGVVVPPGRRSLIRYCVDWSEQRHHLAGMLGRSILDRFLSAGWIRRRETGRSVQVTPDGRTVLAEALRIHWNAGAP